VQEITDSILVFPPNVQMEPPDTARHHEELVDKSVDFTGNISEVSNPLTNAASTCGDKTLLNKGYRTR
jgi:hypothetical protein